MGLGRVERVQGPQEAGDRGRQRQAIEGALRDEGFGDERVITHRLHAQTPDESTLQPVGGKAAPSKPSLTNAYGGTATGVLVGVGVAAWQAPTDSPEVVPT